MCNFHSKYMAVNQFCFITIVKTSQCLHYIGRLLLLISFKQIILHNIF